MSGKAKKITAVSAQEAARRTGSKVAVASFMRTGSGAHGSKSRRTERRTDRQALRRGSWD